MYSEISAVLEGFFNPIHELSAIQNVSNTPIELTTYLKLRYNLTPDPSNYKRSARTTIGNTNIILVINSEVDRVLQEYTLIDGVPTAVILFPVYVTEDMEFDNDTSEIILAIVTFLCNIASDYISKNVPGKAVAGIVDGYLLVNIAAPFIIYDHVMYETYKARVSFDALCDHIKDIYDNEFKDDSGKNPIKYNVVDLFINNIPTYINLVQDVGIYNLLDNAYIVGDDYINIKVGKDGREFINVVKKDKKNETDGKSEE